MCSKNVLSELTVHPHHPAWAFLTIALGKALEIHPLKVLSAAPRSSACWKPPRDQLSEKFFQKGAGTATVLSSAHTQFLLAATRVMQAIGSDAVVCIFNGSGKVRLPSLCGASKRG